MKLKSVSAFLLYVDDLKRTTEFYQKLGFEVRKQSDEQVTVGINWFTITFIPAGREQKPEFQKEAGRKPRGSGVYFYLSVDDVDEFYEGVKAEGLQPSSEPRDWPWGNREFVLRDPDGYKLVLFKRK